MQIEIDYKTTPIGVYYCNETDATYVVYGYLLDAAHKKIAAIADFHERTSVPFNEIRCSEIMSGKRYKNHYVVRSSGDLFPEDKRSEVGSFWEAI